MFLIIQNDPECPAGSCHEILASCGSPFVTVAAYGDQPLPDHSSLTGVIVLGGEMGVHDTERHPHLLRVGSFINTALERGIPLLGICLGGAIAGPCRRRPRQLAVRSWREGDLRSRSQRRRRR